MTQTEKKISSKFIYFFGSFGGILFGYDIGVMTGRYKMTLGSLGGSLRL